ncbi:MAG: hypothetical protein RBT59_13020 [Arcobacteraceae bacterium]|jgi:hypothetical protein|nr:hypothetical protein [Arcobacteraceae bacterium]
MSRGTYEGDIDEIKFVKRFNRNKENFHNYLKNFKNSTNHWMVRVTTKQLSKLSNQKVFTRADTYLAIFKTDITDILKENNYYLTEDILTEENIEYEKIPFSGISVKMTDSSNYQILKIGPNSFSTLFSNYELGAGASLYCLRDNELQKNLALINGWNTTPEKMAMFFKDYTNEDVNFHLNQEVCKQIKNYSCKKIEDIINDSQELQQKIFNGKDLYDEPYTAWYFYHGDDIVVLKSIPFSVTTGSGRSHGDYTIVLKPINR